MLNDDVFSLGRTNAQEGGLKGIDTNTRDNILVVTTEHLLLAFYDLDDVMRMTSLQVDDEIKEKSLERDIEIETMKSGLRRHFDQLGRWIGAAPGPR